MNVRSLSQSEKHLLNTNWSSLLNAEAVSFIKGVSGSLSVQNEMLGVGDWWLEKGFFNSGTMEE